MSGEWWGWLAWSVLALAAIGVVGPRPTRRVFALATMAIIGLLLALGPHTIAFRLAYDVEPGVRLFREPARWLLLPTLALSALAAIGF